MEREILALTDRLEAAQRVEREQLGAGNADFERDLWHNYRVLQVYDILSLYFCWNGYEKEGDNAGELAARFVGPVPVDYGSEEEVELAITPVGERTVRIDPYPFDVSPLPIAVRARTVEPLSGGDEAAHRSTFYRAPRTLLTFEIRD